MTSEDVSTAIARRQAAAYRQHPEVQDTLAQGRALAPSIRIPSVRNMDGREPPAELVAVRRDALHRGRQTRDRERDQAVRARLSELGYTDLCAYLRTEYAAGDSLVDLRAATGLGTQRLKATSPLGWPGGCCCLHG